MGRRTAREKNLHKKIALHRMNVLFQLAESSALQGQMYLADRYVELARRIAMRYLVSIPPRFKRCYCKHCYRYLLPGVNSRIRIHRGTLIISCLQCHQQTRMPLHHRPSPS